MEKFLNSLVLLIFLIYPFGQVVTFYPSILNILSILGWVRVHPLDLLVGVLVVSWFGWQILKKGKINTPPGAKYIFAFIALALLSWLVNLKNYTQSEILVSLLYLIRWIAYSGVYFLIFNFHFPFSIFHFPFKPAMLLLISGLISAVFGLLQYIFFPDMRALTALGWDPHYYRLVGTFLDPGFTGMIYVLSLILLVAQHFNSFEHLNRKKAILYTLYFILYSSLALTYSRSSYLAYLIGMAVIAYFKKSWPFFSFILVLGIITLIILPQPGGEGVKLGRTSTAWARIEDYQHAVAIIRDHPIFGIGFNFYRYAQRDYGFLEDDWQENHGAAGVSSSLVFVLAAAGFFGFLTYLLLQLFFLKKLYYLYVQERQAIALTALASLLALITHASFNNSLFYPWIMLWQWILLGAVFKKKNL